MASIVSRPNGHYWIQFKKPDGKRGTLRLGKCSRNAAATYRQKIERLLECVMLQQAIDRATLDWLHLLPDATYARIAKLGLIPERPRQSVAGLVEYVLLQKAKKKERTRKELTATGENLKDFFTSDRQLSTITAGDADEFSTYLQTKANKRGKNKGEGLAGTTAQKRLQKAGAMFRTAKRKGWITDNPFEDVTISHAQPDQKRIHFVDAETTYKILDACEDWRLQLLIALARFGGMRHPSETRLLRWSWIDWENDSITFRSPKTEHMPGKDWRTIPIFAELRPYLDRAYEKAGEGCDDVILSSLTSTGTALSNRFRRLCRRVGIEPWPKPWVNMRSTRETEIEELFGLKCACDWIGNTATIAKRHYLQVTKEHHARAVSNGAGAKRPPVKRRSKRRSTE